MVKDENNNVTDGQVKIYNDTVLLYEMGCCYGEMLYILNKWGDSPTRYPESFPIKSFTDVFMKAVSIGIPEKLHRRLGQMFAHIDTDDWSESYDKLLPVEKRMFFVWGRCGIKIDHLEKEYQDRCSNDTDAR